MTFNQKSGQSQGTFYVLLCVALWGLIPVVARYGQQSLDNHQFLFWSSLVSFVVLITNAGFAGQLSAIRAMRVSDWVFLLWLGLLGTYVYYLFLYLGYAKAEGLEVLVVQYTWPVLIVVLSVLLLGERLTSRKLIAVVLGFAGVVVVLTRGELDQIQLSNAPVIALVGAGSFCFALFSVLSKRVSQPPLLTVSVYFLAALISAFASMLFFSGFALPTATEILPILLNGVLVNGYSYIFWFKALNATQASYLAPFTFITPALSAVYLLVIFDEPFVTAYAVGLALIIVGGLWNRTDRA